MTTKVIIELPAPNHEDVVVYVVDPHNPAIVMDRTRLRQGDKTTKYVHGNATIRIEEVAVGED